MFQCAEEPPHYSLLRSSYLADDCYASELASLEKMHQSELRGQFQLMRYLLTFQNEQGSADIKEVKAALESEKHILEAELATLTRKLSSMENDLNKQQILEKKLEVCEAHNDTLKSEKVGLTQELITAQATIRKLYKELQFRKKIEGHLYRKEGMLLAPPELYKNAPRPVQIKAPIIPKQKIQTNSLYKTPGRPSDGEDAIDTVEVVITAPRSFDDD